MRCTQVTYLSDNNLRCKYTKLLCVFQGHIYGLSVMKGPFLNIFKGKEEDRTDERDKKQQRSKVKTEIALETNAPNPPIRMEC